MAPEINMHDIALSLVNFGEFLNVIFFRNFMIISCLECAV